MLAQGSRLACSCIHDDDQDDGAEDDGREDHEDDDYEGHAEEDHRREAHDRQEGCEGQRQEDGRGHEEEGRWPFRPEDPEPGVGGHLRWEVDAAHGGDEEDLGVHQKARLEQRPGHQAGFVAQGDLPGCESGYVEDGRLRLEAPVLEALGEPRTLSRSVPTPRRALEPRPHRLRSWHLSWATELDQTSPDSSSLNLFADLACSSERWRKTS